MLMPERYIGETLNEYFSRLAAASLNMIRISDDYDHPDSVVIAKPVVICGKDTSDDIRPARMDTDGRLDVTGVCPEHQADAFFQDSSPVSGTKYEVLAETEFVRVISIAAQVKWTVQPTPLEIYVTVDGQTLTATRNNPVDSSWYYIFHAANTGGGTLMTNTSLGYAAYKAFLLEGRSVKIEVEITGGTVSLLKCVVKWAKW